VTSAEQQKWVIRIGTAFAFLTKTLLASAITTVYAQHVWKIFRGKPFTIAGIDAILAASHDIESLSSLEMLWSAKGATLLALAIW